MSGKAVDWQNKPIKGAEITINNTGEVVKTLLATPTPTATTGSGSVRVAAVNRFALRLGPRQNYLHYPFKLSLFVEDDSAFSPEAGAVKNLTLKVAGPRSNFGDSGYYGGRLEVDNHSSAHFPNIEVTLEQVGPLVDGSTRGTQVACPDCLYSHNVPVGRYKITPRDVQTNKPLAGRSYFYEKSGHATKHWSNVS